MNFYLGAARLCFAQSCRYVSGSLSLIPSLLRSFGTAAQARQPYTSLARQIWHFVPIE
jgi:hypothetical protein